jgi:peptidyl-prolyl cis-trans isomerase B (cyclophilin B)
MTTGPETDARPADDVELVPEPSRPAGPPLRQIVAGLVALVLVAAAVVGVYIWNGRTDSTSASAAPTNPGPQVGDHWHAYFGLAVCSPDYVPVPATAAARGLFSAADQQDAGVVHIQPTAADNAGANATLDRFLSAFGVAMTKDQIVVNGAQYPPSGQCTGGTNGEPTGAGHLTWTLNGRRMTSSPGDYVPADGDVILVSFNPSRTVLKPPTNTAQLLANPSGHPDLARAQAQLACISKPAPTPPAQAKQFAQADQVIDATKTYTATITTSCGDLTIALDAVKAPKTVNNFVFLAQQGYFDGTPIHRVAPGFVIQAGDPTGQGTGGPGYTFADENLGPNFSNGTVAMANSGAGTNGSQFFIVTSSDAATDLNSRPNFSIFGQVSGGTDVISLLDSFGDPTSQSGAPFEPLYILSVKIAQS